MAEFASTASTLLPLAWDISKKAYNLVGNTDGGRFPGNPSRARKILVAGLAGSGKSSLINALTGTHSDYHRKYLVLYVFFCPIYSWHSYIEPFPFDSSVRVHRPGSHRRKITQDRSFPLSTPLSAVLTLYFIAGRVQPSFSLVDVRVEFVDRSHSQVTIIAYSVKRNPNLYEFTEDRTHNL